MSNEITMQDQQSPEIEKEVSLAQTGQNSALDTVKAFAGALLGFGIGGATLNVVGGMGGGLNMAAITPQAPLPTFDMGFDTNMTAGMGAPSFPTPTSGMA